MHEYGLSLSEALDIPSRIAADLMGAALKRKKTEMELLFITEENMAGLIQIKIAELFTGKEIKYDKPYKDQKKQLAKISDEQVRKLEALSRL